MKCLNQLKVLLWKDFLLRIRHKGTLTLLIVWPIIVFFTLFAMRLSINIYKVPTCQFKARALPSAGLLPFVQSYICSVNDDCDPIRKYERIPSYKDATLTPLLRKLQPIVTNSTIVESVAVLPNAVQLLNAFSKALEDPVLKEILTTGIPINEIFMNPVELKKTILNDYSSFTEEIVDTVFNGSIKTDHVTELIAGVNISELVCNPKTIERYIRLPSKETYSILSNILCSLNEEMLTDLTTDLAAQADVGKILKFIFDSNFMGIVRKEGVSSDDLSNVIAKLPNLLNIIPEFSDVFADMKKVITKPHQETERHSARSGNWLHGASKLLCGHSIIAEEDKIRDIIAKLKDKTDFQKEIKQLPVNCRPLYRNITALPNGKLIWTYMKPLIRGKILYTPDNEFTRNILSNANTTFTEINTVQILLESIYKGLTNLGKFASSATKIKTVMEVPAIAKIFGNTTSGISFNDIVEFVKGDGVILEETLRTMLDVLDCVSVNRYEPVSDEFQLEVKAAEYLADNEFLAGVVFLNLQDISSVPKEINYKIRMDIDNVPTTSILRYPFWFPGPESEFEYQRYYRGFIQLQDSIDKSIIKYYTNQNNNITINGKDNSTSIKSTEFSLSDHLGGTYMQEMPYPCWKSDVFQNGLYVAQGLQACFFFAFIMSVSSSVRYLVWERESGNVELMRTMGLKVWVNTLSWFITTAIEMTVVITIIVLMLKMCNVLPNSNWFLIYVYFLCYGLSILMSCYMLQSFCKTASIAAIGIIIFHILTFLPFVIVIAMDAAISKALQIFLQLSMSSSFSYGCLLISRLEAQGVGLSWNDIWSPITENGTSLITSAAILIFDALLYFAIGLIVSTIKSKKSAANSDERNIDLSKPEVRLTNVSKIYNKGKPNEKVALSDITIALPDGKITVLLGENGAGKTTLIKLLTGTIKKSSGIISIGKGGKNIGVCPQNNVLFDVLTPLEHLKLYSRLKAEDTDSKKYMIDSMLSALDLGPFENYYARNLSDGLKRRLCVAIAFIGYPKLIILDEPSSGVDPVARKGLLNLVGKLTTEKSDKIQSTVLLTTHHMDEANFISDTLMVMNKGKIMASGTPRELKQKHCYYILTVRFSQKQDINEQNRKGKYMQVLSLLKDVINDVETIEEDEQQVKIKLPFCNNKGESSNFYLALKSLEEKQSSMGIDKFYLENGGLSDVMSAICFSYKENGYANGKHAKINLSTDTLNENNDNGVKEDSKDDLSHLLNADTIPEGSAATFNRFTALLTKRAIGVIRNKKALMVVLVLPALVQAVAMGFSQIKPPVELEHSLKLHGDMYPGYQFLSSNLMNGAFGQDLEEHLFARSQLKKSIFNYKNITSECECNNGEYVCYPHVELPGIETNNYENIIRIPSAEETVRWIVKTNQLFIQKRYGGWSVEKEPRSSKAVPVVWYNNKGYHSMPGLLNRLNNVLLNMLDKNSTETEKSRINTYSHPLRISKEQLGKSTLLHHIADAGISLVILVGFSLVTSSSVSYLVQERISHEKRLQLLSGVSPVLYWCTTFIWDLLVSLMVIAIAAVIMLIFDIPIYTGRQNLSGITLLLFLFCYACLPLMYIFEKLFQVNSLANMLLFVCNVFTGMVTVTTILLLEVLGKTQAVADIRNLLHSIFLVIPQFAMSDGLIEISRNYVQATLLERFSIDSYVSPISWELLGSHYSMLIIVGTIVFIANVLLEYHLFPKNLKMNRSYEDEYDIDVQKEKVRVCERTGPLSEAVAIKNIYKNYGLPCSSKVSAVKGVSFGVPLGQCFGLLGINGAGKSTIFKMLIGELRPSRGVLETYEKHNSGGISYCPQNDALDPLMTPKEHIVFYARLRRIKNEEMITKNTLKKFGLIEYQNIQVQSLSGGNKRKLNAAISFMGNSKIIIMDEPTSGMDPNSRSHLLQKLKSLSKANRSVLVTSHSISDCEAVCKRVAIMVSGKLLAIGSPHELKTRFFSGNVISIHISDLAITNNVKTEFLTSIPQAQCLGTNYHTIHYLVPNLRSISELFYIMTDMSAKYDIDYTIALPSLDNVFVNLCKVEENTKYQTEKHPNGTIPLNNITVSINNRTEDTITHL